ncbi:unnamed protein product [Didymodactylos carnosus]|uniref:Tyrosine-protein kinase n=1 Tax=Didymodactylos carnosus TaxID=1234261 RepID=A0A8S2R0P4_9BILA|nr:unnamed protein product [Didymodactylos carnosus]CAF4142647.1 unnamed protein product [Didymodactylos carnosus]
MNNDTKHLSYKHRVQNFLQEVEKKTQHFFVEHPDAKIFVENARDIAKRTEQRLNEAKVKIQIAYNDKNGDDIHSNIKSPSSPAFRSPSATSTNSSSTAPPSTVTTTLTTNASIPILNGRINPSYRASLQYIALFDYDARTSEDLTIRKGDLLEIVSRQNNAWWKARSDTGREGYIPSNYVARRDSLESEPWYFKSIHRIDAEKILMSEVNEHGSFLVRDSETRRTDFSLSIRDNETIKHYRIRQTEDGRFYITRRTTFLLLTDLIVHYSQQADGLCVNLRQPCVHIVKPEPEGLSHNTVDQWEIRREDVKLIRRLGQGQFGDVYEGVWNNSTPVAIKTLKSGSMNPLDFLAEACIMKKLRHPNLIQLFAVCTVAEPIYILTELMKNGSLLDYLQSPRGRQLEMLTLIYMATQISRGMACLESQNYIHRDLAARNVLVGENNIVKIADFGLARVIKDYHTGIYDAKEGTKFPIKWTAPEAALYNTFTIKSDVWSFGILLTEVVTYGRTPYPG